MKRPRLSTRGDEIADVTCGDGAVELTDTILMQKKKNESVAHKREKEMIGGTCGGRKRTDSSPSPLFEDGRCKTVPRGFDRNA